MPTKKRKYAAALIGCGGIGYRYDRNRSDARTLTHFRALRASGRFEIGAVVDPDDGIRAEVERDYGIKSYRDYRELVAGGPFDLVVVASPDDTHTEILTALLKFRPRLVFCEKPLARSLQELESLASRYADAGIGLAVNYTRRFLAEFSDIKRRIDEKNLGRVSSVCIYYSRGFEHNACHYLDLLHWWFGAPERIIVEGSRSGLNANDPTLNVFLGYKQGLEVRLIGLETDVTLVNEIDIIGTAGRVRVDTLGNIDISHPQAHPHYDMFRHYVSSERRVIEPGGALPRALANLCAWLDGTQQLLTPAQTSIAVQHTMDRIRKLAE